MTTRSEPERARHELRSLGTEQPAAPLFIDLTAAGAFHAVADPQPEPIRRLLLAVLQQPQTPLLEPTRLLQWSGCETLESAMEWLEHARSMAWIRDLAERREYAPINIERDLPILLDELAGGARGLLADDHGFYLARAGFDHATAEEIAALSADLAALQQRHAGLLERRLALQSSAWAVIDASGNAKLGLWPLYIGSRRFVLALETTPCFDKLALRRLVGGLCQRYSQ